MEYNLPSSSSLHHYPFFFYQGQGKVQEINRQYIISCVHADPTVTTATITSTTSTTTTATFITTYMHPTQSDKMSKSYILLLCLLG